MYFNFSCFPLFCLFLCIFVPRFVPRYRYNSYICIEHLKLGQMRKLDVTSKKIKRLVYLREKKTPSGSISLILDIVQDGIRVKESLGLILQPETSKEAIRANNELRRKAEIIRADRERDIENGKARITKDKLRNKILLMDWLATYREHLVKVKYKRIGIHDNLVSTLRGYKPAAKLALVKMDKAWAADFIAYLRDDYISPKGNKHLKPNSIVNLVRTLSIAINAAIKDGFLMVNPFKLLDRKEKVLATDSSREHLTRDEINRIIDTPCRREDIKRAFLFSCFCGLRMGDIKNLRWGDIKEDNGQFSLNINMKKTGHALSLPLNDAAVALMGERSENMEDRVFPKFAVSTGPTIEYNLGLLMDSAGIKKHITFHCARHCEFYSSLIFSNLQRNIA